MGTLYVVGTPIGNLEDISPRVARILSEVALVAAEDTRRTRALLTHLGLGKPMVALYADVERRRAPQVLEALDSGDVAYCTDGGMPAVSDPGAYLVDQARSAGHDVIVIPGPSAVTAAVAASGFRGDRFRFFGFPPRKSAQMKAMFEELVDDRETLVMFESPQRLLKTLDIISATLPQRRCAVARELTKVHEEVRVGRAAELAEHYRRSPAKGEITLVLEGAQKSRH
ncbi:MAG: rRNA (cytidine1402-2-O)-methyltransferase [Chloroflexota bacterium]|jgi:16S rRNA (cytidine1402-2'-O)-methyltransferase|nr:rRNA (cytidine1402-2-O)-methyltransferase [Chloroflexota bacterium]